MRCVLIECDGRPKVEIYGIETKRIVSIVDGTGFLTDLRAGLEQSGLCMIGTGNCDMFVPHKHLMVDDIAPLDRQTEQRETPRLRLEYVADFDVAQVSIELTGTLNPVSITCLAPERNRVVPRASPVLRARQSLKRDRINRLSPVSSPCLLMVR